MIIFFSNLAMVLFENALIMKWGDLWGYFISISVYCISMLSVYVVQVLKSYYYLMPLMQKYGLVYQWEEVASYFPLWDSSMSLKVVYFILPIICVAYVLVGFIMAKKVIQEKEFY
ncbi:MAG TPA: hypothetical protein IAC41_12305 [Candidatus Merdenecus merdavium]|nr:hypothetical protein [Candidatus Merdenecus merdavium]